ncbi:phosphatidylserine synthase (macronuclear) [Tetrahymena thermophila SB210]|uniref:Phosphatidylserine synthase n=1 Tax=Tetrahymena thermophila (strain SB210) TaxID=312017 RepID=Q23DR8_TETTS|nr:phosphatidylserine synthase [Tetrahymena thermophila SB210]EAR94564.1 phosphatidylserine synthase [Tetrahymena thermophila SB210]|eukprot:XP_001014618.1 phosphatidylserine synthase [Tetrahymena thermophila SB210]
MRYAEQILFTVVFGGILYFALQHTDNSESNYRRGLLGAFVVFIAEGTLRNYKGPFLRPNEAFWRGVLRFCLIYVCSLVFLSFQNTKDARNIFKHLDPELGKQVSKDYHTYDDNCELEWDNILDNFDHYFQIHLINWFCATLIVRDPYILHTWSILDELIELSAQHILPHFRECWWDHVFHDVILSNTTAIVIGLLVCKLFKLQPYDWLGRKDSKGFFDWKVWKCHRRFGGLLAIWFVIITNFLCGFFMINSLWIPPQNFLNLYRLLVWFLLSNLAFKEIYVDIDTWGTKKRVENPISGKCRWITFFITFTEAFIALKFIQDAGNIQFVPTPLYISVPWIIVISSSIMYYLYLRFKPDHTTKYPLEYYQKEQELKQIQQKKLENEKPEKTQQNKQNGSNGKKKEKTQ